jgi:iron complex outermembrane recepter protein
MKLELLTASTLENNLTYIDWDNSPYDLVDDLDNSELRVFSEEMQLSGQRGKVTWFGGLYYWNQNLKQRFVRYVAEEFTDGQLDVNTVFNSPRCLAMGFTKNNCQDVFQTTMNQRYDTLQQYNTDGYAAFGEATINFTKSLDLIVGLRYHNQNNDSQSYTPNGATADPSCSGNPSDPLGLPAPPTAATPPIALCARPPTTNMQFASGVDMYAGTLLGPVTKLNFDKLTKKVALQKQFRDGLMGYVSYSEGFDSGGVSTPTISGIRTLIPYDPETVENSEIGMRSDWAGGKLRFNATLFHTVWKNIQNLGVVFDAQGNQVPTLVTTNVGEALSQGTEFELSILPTQQFLVNLNIGLLHTEYTYIKPGTFSLNTATAFAQAPDRTYNIGLQYTAMGSKGGSFITRVDWSYSSQFWRSLPFLRMSWYSAVPANYDESGNTSQVNLRLTYEPPSKSYQLSIFGTNLGNTYLLDSGFFHGIWGYDFATVARPREAGVSFSFKF